MLLDVIWCRKSKYVSHRHQKEKDFLRNYFFFEGLASFNFISAVEMKCRFFRLIRFLQLLTPSLTIITGKKTCISIFQWRLNLSFSASVKTATLPSHLLNTKITTSANPANFISRQI